MSKHSRERAFERYNIELTSKQEKEIMQKIRNNEHIYLYDSEQDPKHLKFCYIVYENIPLKILYKKTNKKGITEIVTIYPFDVEEYNEKQQEREINRINKAIEFLKNKGYVVYKKSEKKGN